MANVNKVVVYRDDSGVSVPALPTGPGFGAMPYYTSAQILAIAAAADFDLATADVFTPAATDAEKSGGGASDATITPGLFRWMRVGNILQCSGVVEITTALTDLATFKLALPTVSGPYGVFASLDGAMFIAPLAAVPADVASPFVVEIGGDALTALISGAMALGKGPFKFNVTFMASLSLTP